MAEEAGGAQRGEGWTSFGGLEGRFERARGGGERGGEIQG